MADEDLSLEEPQGGDAEQGGSGLNKKMLIIIAAVSAVLIIGGAVVAWLILGGDEDDSTTEVVEEVIASAAPEEESTGDATASKIPPPPKGEYIYVSVPDPFLVNIKANKRTRMMQIKVQFLVRSKEAEDAVRLHMPLIRNNLLDFFSTANADEVSSREGRKLLKDEAFKVSQQVMVEQAGFEAIEMLLFTGFVIQ